MPLMYCCGSSPRVWGIRALGVLEAGFCRFIPTRVGNTGIRIFRGLGDTVHPHACGEYYREGQTMHTRRGSSPRVWGIPGITEGPHSGGRFIPTRVGNTPWLRRYHGQPAVHPHACGEYVEALQQLRKGHGSSPRVWGIPALPSARIRRRRFIPTRVGNTPVAAPGPQVSTVHPHACGEYYASASRTSCAPGSSPRVWGILHISPECSRDRRFIPTRVGNTMVNRGSWLRTLVHPHACGEYSSGRCKK